MHEQEACVYAASFFFGFSADESAAVRLSEGARGGFRDATFTLNTADAYGSCIGIGRNAAAWVQSATLSSNTDLATETVKWAPVIAQGEGSRYFNSKLFQNAVSAAGEPLSPEVVDQDELRSLGFLVGEADGYERIAQVRALCK